MARDRSIYMGPRLRRLRRERGLTQADMAGDLDISPSYVALLERNQRPLTADLLLRLASIYALDIAQLSQEGSNDDAARLAQLARDPMFADIDLPGLEIGDMAVNMPGMTEAMLRLYASYKQEQISLADRIAAGDGVVPGEDPVGEAQRFLSQRRNSFPPLDDAGEQLAHDVGKVGGLPDYLRTRHGIKVRRLPAAVMMGALRRFDRHRSELLLDDTLDAASQRFQLALQIAYLDMRGAIDALVSAAAPVPGESGGRLIRRSLGGYGAAALLMPYAAFASAVEARAYDVEALARQFGTSFEQTAHRLTTLQRPGAAQVPFFFLRIDQAGNVSKRLDGGGFPFAQHGGACPLWSVHQAFLTPRRLVTQWLELPGGERFFSIARTVTAGGGAYGAVRVERAIALGCASEHAHRLVYTQAPGSPDPDQPTPIGPTCRLCQRIDCTARSAPPIGRLMVADDYRRSLAPFGFGD